MQRARSSKKKVKAENISKDTEQIKRDCDYHMPGRA